MEARFWCWEPHSDSMRHNARIWQLLREVQRLEQTAEERSRCRDPRWAHHSLHHPCSPQADWRSCREAAAASLPSPCLSLPQLWDSPAHPSRLALDHRGRLASDLLRTRFPYEAFPPVLGKTGARPALWGPRARGAGGPAQVFLFHVSWFDHIFNHEACGPCFVDIHAKARPLYTEVLCD